MMLGNLSFSSRILPFPSSVSFFVVVLADLGLSPLFMVWAAVSVVPGHLDRRFLFVTLCMIHQSISFPLFLLFIHLVVRVRCLVPLVNDSIVEIQSFELFFLVPEFGIIDQMVHVSQLLKDSDPVDLTLELLRRSLVKLVKSSVSILFAASTSEKA